MDYQKEFLGQVDAHMKKSGEVIEILAVAGPNGGGKTTLIRGLLKKFPESFCEVVQVTTRHLRKTDRARRSLSQEMFSEEKVILRGKAGIYDYGYTSGDLMKAIKKNKIIIFEGISRLRKLESILGYRGLRHMIVGVLPSGKTVHAMIVRLRVRLLARQHVSEVDVQKKLQDAKLRVIPEVLRESHMIIRSIGNRTDSDVEKVMKKWKKNMK